MNKSAIITIHKTKFDFRFGIGFLGRLLKHLDNDINGVLKEMTDNPFETIPIIMYTSAKYGFDRKGEECNCTVYDFIDFIDADGGIQAKSVEKFLKAFTDSITEDVPVDENVVDEKKIKAPKKDQKTGAVK